MDWRNSLLVGGATFLVGSVLMEIGDKPKGDIGWWPYVGTFISGAVGFMLLTNEYTPKSLELNAEGKSTYTMYAREYFEQHDNEKNQHKYYALFKIDTDGSPITYWSAYGRLEGYGRAGSIVVTQLDYNKYEEMFSKKYKKYDYVGSTIPAEIEANAIDKINEKWPQMRLGIKVKKHKVVTTNPPKTPPKSPPKETNARQARLKKRFGLGAEGEKNHTIIDWEYFEKHDEGKNEHKYYALFIIDDKDKKPTTYWSAYGRLEGFGRASSIVVNQFTGYEKYSEMYNKKFEKYDYIGGTIPYYIEFNTIQKMNEKWPQMQLGEKKKKSPPKSPPKETNPRKARLQKRFGLGAEDGRPKIEAICDKLGFEYYTMHHIETGFQNVHHKSCKHWDMAEANTNYGRTWFVGSPTESIQDELLSHMNNSDGETGRIVERMKEKGVKTLRDAIKVNNKHSIKFDFAPCFKKTDKYPAILDEPFDFEKSFGAESLVLIDNCLKCKYKGIKAYHIDGMGWWLHCPKCNYRTEVAEREIAWEISPDWDIAQKGPVISPIDVNWASDFIKKAKLVKNFGAEMFDTRLGEGMYGEVYLYDGKAMKIVDLEKADNRLQADFFEKIYLMNQKGMKTPDSLVKIIHYNRGTITPELSDELEGNSKLDSKPVGSPIAIWVMELVPTIYNQIPRSKRIEHEGEYKDEMRGLGNWTEKNLNYQIGDLHDENIGIREDDSLVVFDPHINKVGDFRRYGFIHVAETNE